MTDAPRTPPSSLQVAIDDDGVCLLRLDDGKANALTMALIADLHTALDRALEDARAVVLLGRPGRFSAGFDLSVMSAGDQPMQELVLAGAELMLRIYGHPQPVVAGCTGHALAGGAILLLAADTRIGAAGAHKIGLNEVGIGMALPVFALELARDRLDPRALTACTVQGRVLDPEGAVAAGYLDHLCPPDEVEGVALDAARGLAAHRPRAVATTKRSLRGATLRRVRATLVDDVAALTLGSPR